MTLRLATTVTALLLVVAGCSSVPGDVNATTTTTLASMSNVSADTTTTSTSAPAHLVEIRGTAVAATEFSIEPGVDPFGYRQERTLGDWEPKVDDRRLGLRLHFDWPEKYREQYDQYFNPWTYGNNAGSICAFIRQNDATDSSLHLADEMYERMLEYTEYVDGARYVLYEFEHSHEGWSVPSGWTSAFGNGLVLAGTLVLHECTGDPDYLDTVWELYEGMIRFRGTTSDPMWVTHIFDDHYVWFEEFPMEDDVQPRILNGHLYPVWSLYDLYEFTGDFEVLELLRAGLTSVAGYGWEYRRPGQVNLYDLRPPDADDYGPARTIHQQNVLYEMTGADIFKELRNAFAEDMPEGAEQLGLKCLPDC